MKIAIGNDHVAIDMKNDIVEYLKSKGHDIINVGTDSSESTHYPIWAKKVCDMVVSGKVEKGILICGTGIGISIAANKVKGIRAVACSEPYSAKLSVQHNNSNILAFGARVVGIEMAKMIVDNWIDAQFEGGRHQIRIDMIEEIQNNE